jgi:hypothetical protein
LDTNQEHVPPITDVFTNVCSAEVGAIASHIKGIAKNSNKSSYCPITINATDIELSYESIDGMELIFALFENIIQHLSPEANRGIVSLLMHIDTYQFIPSTRCRLLNSSWAATNHVCGEPGHTSQQQASKVEK